MIPYTANQPVPNKYFILENGDVIRPNDEYYNPFVDKWIKVDHEIETQWGNITPIKNMEDYIVSQQHDTVNNKPIRRKNPLFWEAYLAQFGVPASAISEGTNFGARITKKAAEQLMRDLKKGIRKHAGFPDKYPFDIMCKEYGQDDDWWGMETDDLNSNGQFDSDYQTFEIFLNV